MICTCSPIGYRDPAADNDAALGDWADQAARIVLAQGIDQARAFVEAINPAAVPFFMQAYQHGMSGGYAADPDDDELGSWLSQFMRSAGGSVVGSALSMIPVIGPIASSLVSAAFPQGQPQIPTAPRTAPIVQAQPAPQPAASTSPLVWLAIGAGAFLLLRGPR